MTRPQLWVLAGGNGAGKTTFYRQFLEPRRVLFANADEIARQIDPTAPEQHSYQAAHLVEHLRRQLLRERKSFCFETVFSHPSKVDFVAEAKAAGYENILVIVHLENPALNQARVAQRVSEGGHSVPPDKIVSRIPRTLENLRKTFPLCDQVHILDNSSATSPFERIAVLKGQAPVFLADPLPQWARELLG
ncbi:MAG: hypothetical protein EA417_19735 [Gammaproteobacteria bacterium]|nr:MAG: hypothetical protein EA417_19735 [Gammaproteobacteria bacterium]